ncbi:MAG: mercury resistance system periplasmic binding protein MerP [Betaproteobacteria bacterium]
MKSLNRLLFVVLAAASTAVLAEPKTVALSVSNMTCATCPIAVKKSLTRVPGVSSAAVSFEKSEAVVTFDDAKTNVDALVKATTDAGYPSTAKK